jgi:hypothetical protein
MSSKRKKQQSPAQSVGQQYLLNGWICGEKDINMVQMILNSTDAAKA